MKDNIYIIQDVLLRVRIMISTHACRVVECRRALVCTGSSLEKTERKKKEKKVKQQNLTL